MAALGGQAIQLTNQVIGGDGSLDQPAQAFAGVLVDDGHSNPMCSVVEYDSPMGPNGETPRVELVYED